MRARQLFLCVAVSGLMLTPKLGGAQAASVPAVLDVVVTDKADRPVAGLKAEDFKVVDNKQQRNVIGLREVEGETPNADPAVEAVLLVDEINSSFEVMARERKEIENYLLQSAGPLPIPTSFVFLTETELQYQGQPSRDAKVLLANLEKNPNPQRSFQPQGGFQQAVQMREKSLEALNGLALKLRDRPGRKLVIWISPGWEAFPNLSVQKSAKEMDGLFTYIVSLSTLLREARITLYSVDPYGAQRDLARAANSEYQPFVKGVASAKQADNGNLYLQVIATQTGGKVLYGSNNIARMIDQCLADAQAFYVLSYDAAVARSANEYHGVQIQVGKPGLKARARTGFYAQP
ncbi:MAG: VWA domain-containing protein [Terracidiphilus sp.]|nr:VWA domain-containing protein [Terracidiphilus sp.]